MIKLTPQELTAGRNVMKQCMGVKAGEKVLVVTDPGQKDNAEIFFQTAKEFTDKAETVLVSGMTENAQEPSEEIAAKMKAADAALLVTTYSLSHTQARKNACKSGCRIASMPGITKDMIIRTLSADYSQINRLSRKLAEILTKGKTARLTAPTGTDLTFSLSGRQGFIDGGLYTKPGQWGNLPAGEACIGPLECKTQGILIIDGAKIKVKSGLATEISGGKTAKNLLRQIKVIGPKVRNIAELGIGTNPLAKVCRNLLEAEKVYATCHVALGSNISYGGRVDVPFHSDFLVLQPTLIIDGKIILKDGKFLL